MDNAYCEVENTDPTQHQRWLDKHGFKPDEQGKFPVSEFEGNLPVETEQLFQNIRDNVSTGEYVPIYSSAYDERTFVMVCGGPSLSRHLEEIKEKSLNREKYLIVCSNMTADYLMKNGITPHVHFIIDPQQRKRFDVAEAIPEIEYWINAACHPDVFAVLKNKKITPHIFLADFEAEGKAIRAVKESLPKGQPGMMAIQGGTMAGLRALNLADAMGFRDFEYYGFDACVEVGDGKARPYAYEKKRGEAIIEIACDRCDRKFDTTLILQKQVNEFVQWRHNLAGMNIRVIGDGLIGHYLGHIEELEKTKTHSPQRFTPEYAELQKSLHEKEHYGVTGKHYLPSIFQAISQLAKRHGAVTVLDYGSAKGDVMRLLGDKFWLPPTVKDFRYDPFVEEYSAEPEPADLVLCTDVLEHVEPECTKAVLDHLAKLTLKLAFISISLRPANKVLDDGRNAHINLRDPEFWLRELKKRFVLGEARVEHDGEALLCVAQSIEGVKQTLRERNGKPDTRSKAA